MTILLLTPAPRGSTRGNRVTALRWAKRLRELGHRVTLADEHRDGEWDLVIALHALYHADAIARAKAPVVVGIAGTDLYGGGPLPSLDGAWRIVVLQPRAIDALPLALQNKSRAIVQSARGLASTPDMSAFEVCVIGHLRDVKDPLRAAEASRLLPASSRIRVAQLGDALDEKWALAARAEEQANPRYRWLGALSRQQTLERLARARLLVVSSRSEGGANVVSEALAARVPVISSRIDGSLGVLGDDYPGYFPVGDTAALAALLDRCERDLSYYNVLRAACARLAPLVDPVRERRAWQRLLAEATPEPDGRFTLRELDAADPGAMQREVEIGLSSAPKHLACRFFYDDEGSMLFEQICDLPEYDLWRNEAAILRAHAGEIAARFPSGTRVVELGSGSATKTRMIIDAMLRCHARLDYLPIDVSRAALVDSARELLLSRPGLTIHALAAEYESGLAALPKSDAPTLVLFLGSNIGNFHRDEAAAFLGRVRARLRDGDALLLGVDLRKPRAIVEPAYDDAAGVTARFNLNLLQRINRDLDGNFDLDAFSHRAVYDEAEGRVDMFLVSRRAQRARVRDRVYELAEGEPIHTECSYKYSREEIARLARGAGLAVEATLSTRDRFAVVLLRA